MEHAFQQLLFLFLVGDSELERCHALHHLNPVLALLKTIHWSFEFSRTGAVSEVLVKLRRRFLRIVAAAFLQMFLLDLVDQNSNILVVLELFSVGCLHVFYRFLLSLGGVLGCSWLSRVLLILRHVEELVFFDQHRVVVCKELLGWLVDQTWHLQRLAHILVDQLLGVILDALYLLILH